MTSNGDPLYLGKSAVSSGGVSRRAVLRAGGAAALVGAASGCAGDGAPAGQPPSPARGPRYGGTVVLGLSSDPGALNPAITSSGVTHPVTGEIFDGLVLLDRNFRPSPALARSFRVSDDGRSYTFDLVRTRWHDGKPFTSADVKFTFEEVLVKYHPRTRVALGPLLEGVDTPNERTVVFRLKEPYPAFPVLVNEDNGAILPKHIFKGTDPLTNPANSNPVGTGPFMFKPQQGGGRITLVRNPEYFESGRPYLDRIVFRFIPSPAAQFQAFQAGELNLLRGAEPEFVGRLKAMDNVVVTERGQEGFAQVIHLIPNIRREPFNDVRVRQALAYAVDNEFIAKTVFKNQYQAATGPIDHRFEPWYTDKVPKFPHDPRKAGQLLDAAGLTRNADGTRLRTSLIFDQGFAKAADLLRQQLGQIGVQLDLQVMDFGTWVKRLYMDKDFDLGYSRLTDPPDPDIGVKRAYITDNIRKVPFSNGASYSNPKVDKLFADAARESNRGKRVQLYNQLQKILVEDQANGFLVGGIGSWAWNQEFTGFDEAGSLSLYYFGRTAWWTKGSASPSPTR